MWQKAHATHPEDPNKFFVFWVYGKPTSGLVIPGCMDINGNLVDVVPHGDVSYDTNISSDGGKSSFCPPLDNIELQQEFLPTVPWTTVEEVVANVQTREVIK